MTPEQWLYERIKEKGITQTFIAKESGIPGFTAQKLSFTLTGRRKITVDEFLTVCKIIGIDPREYRDQKAGTDNA